MELYGRREGIERLHCGFHSDCGVSRESFLVTSALDYTHQDLGRRDRSDEPSSKGYRSQVK